VRTAIPLGILIVFVATSGCSGGSTQTVVIDKSDCVQFTNGFGSPCAKWEQYGSFIIAVNAPNACAISFEYPDGSDSAYYKEDSLSYVDPDNWECRVIVDSIWTPTPRELMVATMTHGRLNAKYLFADGNFVFIKFTVRSRSRPASLTQLSGN
jgi:hypothetical protein